jgi:hypothetical protein
LHVAVPVFFTETYPAQVHGELACLASAHTTRLTARPGMGRSASAIAWHDVPRHAPAEIGRHRLSCRNWGIRSSLQ